MRGPEGAVFIPVKNNSLTTFASSASVVELNSIRAWNWAENKEKAYLHQGGQIVLQPVFNAN